jgi:hypothetical protein
MNLEKLKNKCKSRYLILHHKPFMIVVFSEFVYCNSFFIESNDNRKTQIN